MADTINSNPGLVRRHGILELVEHWTIALSGIALIVTGILELPIGRRYYITELPGFSWAGDFLVTLSLHYAFAVIFIAAAFFHVFYHGLLGHDGLAPRKGDFRASIDVIKSFFGKGEEPPFGKYLPEQRLAYVGMAFVIAMLIISGLVKTYENLINPQLPYVLAITATWIHNIFSVLFVVAFIAHIAALIIKPNRPLVRGIFTGSVKLDYARHRHPFWLKEIEGTPSLSGTTRQRDQIPGGAESEDTAPKGDGDLTGKSNSDEASEEEPLPDDRLS